MLPRPATRQVLRGWTRGEAPPPAGEVGRLVAALPRLTHGGMILIHAVNGARIAESAGAADALRGVAVESSLSQPEQALAAVPFFSLLAGEELVPLARLLQSQRVAVDEVICAEGEPGDAFFIVRSGSVKICRPQASGNEVLLNILGPGECFGELALLDGKPRSATVQALEPTVLWVLPRPGVPGLPGPASKGDDGAAVGPQRADAPPHRPSRGG